MSKRATPSSGAARFSPPCGQKRLMPRTCREALYQDDDLSALFRLKDDGIEDPDDETNQRLGMGDYRAAAWFNSFLNAEPSDGRRPFRR